MKRFVPISFVLLTAGLLAAPASDAVAQTAKIRIEAMSNSKLKARGLPTWPVTSGLRVVGSGTTVYLSADTTGQGTGLSFSWSLVSVPSGSTASIDTPSNQFVKFTADSAGTYAVQLTVGSSTADTTILATSYVGVGSNFPGCAAGCHRDKVTAWENTGHAKIFEEGITGQLEVNAQGKGAYAPGCVKCHTSGWNTGANNGNFGYLAHQSGWDTTWYKSYPVSGGDYMIPNGDQTQWDSLQSAYPELAPRANIGCESCHGPGLAHSVPVSGQKQNIAKSVDAGVCAQCHDAPTHHMIYSNWSTSRHGEYPNASHASSKSCFPCHSGTAFMMWVDTMSVTGKPPVTWSTATDGGNPLTCSECHDAHGNGNPNQLRTVTMLVSLGNGFQPAPGVGGKAQLCMNCHRSRYNVATRVTNTPPLYGFTDHYGPHGSPQTDMIFGQNGYQYGDTTLTGLVTHAGAVPDLCVTCHMGAGDHSWSMVDTAGNDITTPCQTCHGPITDFDDIKAPYDYDGNGKIEGVQTEVAGLLARLKEKLPIDPLTGEPTTALKDSNLIKGHPEYVEGLWDYYLVVNDGSMGVHNAKYAVSLLQKALGFYPLDVKTTGGIPGEFALEQNYPNPFNPTTNISFALPKEELVKIEVYDILGHLVKSLVNTQMSAGSYQIVWNGTDESGARVASGVYLYRMQAGSFVTAKKMLLVK